MNEGYLKNNNLYNDKELFDDGDLNWYDYGFRNYDAQIGRFTQLDPLTDDYPELTPYQYASCEPIANIDVDGLEGGCVTTVVAAEIRVTITVAQATADVASTVSKVTSTLSTISTILNIFSTIGSHILNSNQQSPKLGDQGHYPAPRGNLKGFPDAVRMPSKKGQRQRWNTKKGFLEWDKRHGEVEKWQGSTGRAGTHLGGFDPETGKQRSPVDPGRKTQPKFSSVEEEIQSYWQIPAQMPVLKDNIQTPQFFDPTTIKHAPPKVITPTPVFFNSHELYPEAEPIEFPTFDSPMPELLPIPL